MESPLNPSAPGRNTQRSRDARKDSNEFKFEVLSEGLGFHPFSDGLPYAPVSKVNTSTAPVPATPSARAAHLDRPNPTRDTGAGAIAAGPPRFAIPAAPTSLPAVTPRPSRQPVASTSIPTLSPPTPVTATTTATAVSAPLAASKTTEAPAEMLLVEDHPGFFILIKRILAWTLDLAFTSALLMAAVSIAFGGTFPFNLDWMLTPEPFLTSILWFGTTNWLLLTFQELVFRTSFGKLIFGLRVSGSAIERFLRAFFFVPSASFLGLGLAWSLLNRQRRCWHDVAANASVIEVTRL